MKTRIQRSMIHASYAASWVEKSASMEKKFTLPIIEKNIGFASGSQKVSQHKEY
jgi:hypothetical protein